MELCEVYFPEIAYTQCWQGKGQMCLRYNLYVHANSSLKSTSFSLPSKCVAKFLSALPIDPTASPDIFDFGHIYVHISAQQKGKKKKKKKGLKSGLKCGCSPINPFEEKPQNVRISQVSSSGGGFCKSCQKVGHRKNQRVRILTSFFATYESYF